MATIPHVSIAFGDLPERINQSRGDVPIPRELLFRLLDLYVSCWDFDEDWYLSAYPDVREAVDGGDFASGWAHFRTTGYLEGRFGHQPTVDAEWYLSMYPDIAEAMLEGKVTSALDHFVEFGYKEGRLPRDPSIHANWYMPRYVHSAERDEADESMLLDHFVKMGYRQLAVPEPPR